MNQKMLGVAVLGVISLLLIGSAAVVGDLWGQPLLVMSVATVACTGYVTWASRRSTALDVCEPIVVLWGLFALCFPLRGVAATWLEEGWAHDLSIQTALLVATIGFLVLAVGYAATPSGNLAKPRTWSYSRVRLWVLVYVVAGASGLVMMWVLTGRMDYLITLDPDVKAPDVIHPFFFYLYWAALLLQVAAVIQLANTLHAGQGYALTTVLWALALASSFATSRIATVFLLLSAACVWAHLRRPLTVRTIVVTSMLLIVYLTVAGLYREVLSAEALGRHPEVILADSGHKMALRYIVKNFDQLYNLSVILEDVPDVIDYQYGSTFAQIFVKPLPRYVFPDKPLGASAILTQHVMPDHAQLGFVTVSSGIGELYLNFSIIGVLWGMAMAGYLGGMSYRWAVSREPWTVLLYAAIVTGLVSWFRMDFNAGSSQALFYGVPIVWVILVATSSRPTVSISGSP